jgi:hypothetical protein
MTPSRSRKRLRRERGASTVEVALSMLLLIPTALYGIYAGEVFLAGTRAQEAEISAAWDVTAYLLHDYDNAQDYESGPNGEPSHYVSVTQNVANRVEAELSGLDSYRGSGNGQQQVISQQRLRNVDCRPMDARYVLDGALLTFQAIPYQSRDFLHRGGYVACSARVSFLPQLMPRDMRVGYTSKEDLLAEQLAEGFTLCGSGKSLWGCEGERMLGLTREHEPGIIVLTNDWGLEDGRDNPVGTQANQKYYNVGEKIYKVKMWNDPTELAGGIGSQQVREAMKFMLDEADADWGQTSVFKLAYSNDMSKQVSYPANNHNGVEHAHMNPWDDGEGSYTSTRNVHNSRNQNHYLGHRNPNFLDSPP